MNKERGPKSEPKAQKSFKVVYPKFNVIIVCHTCHKLQGQSTLTCRVSLFFGYNE
jgi:hypothetical protein